MKIDGRQSGNTPESVLCRLAGEIAYVQKRLCIRRAHDEVREQIEKAAANIEEALKIVERCNDADAEARKIYALTAAGARFVPKGCEDVLPGGVMEVDGGL